MQFWISGACQYSEETSCKDQVKLLQKCTGLRAQRATIKQLIDVSNSLKDLTGRTCGFSAQIFLEVLCVSLPHLLDLGFTAGELRIAQVSAKRLKQAGLSAKEPASRFCSWAMLASVFASMGEF